jgi:hypothetical protein
VVTVVRIAARTGTAACGHLVAAGQLEARRDGRWACFDCAVLAVRGERDDPVAATGTGS